MSGENLNRHCSGRGWQLAAALCTSLWLAATASASITHGLDSNSRLEVKSTLVRDKGATVLFSTWADRGDEMFARPCSRFYYSVEYSADGSASPAQLEAGDLCGSYLNPATILDNGDVLLLEGQGVQRWRKGEMLGSLDFSALPATRGLALERSMDVQQFDFNHRGDLLVTASISGYMAADRKGGLGVMVSLRLDGSKRWDYKIPEEGLSSQLGDAWIGADGSALLRLSVHEQTGLQLSTEERLVHLDAAGVRIEHTITRPQDMSQFDNLKPEDMQRYMEYQRDADPESLKHLTARARDKGGFDVLYWRKGGGAQRDGFFLLRLNRDGSKEKEYALGGQIDDYGLGKWVDFYLEGDRLVLLSRAVATQSVGSKHRNKWVQNVVGFVDLESGDLVSSRLLPLDQRYLQAALASGDEDRRNLRGFPDTEPQGIDDLAGTPLISGRGWVERKWALRLDSAGDNLPAFTEAMDRRKQAMAKAENKRANKARREQATEEFNAEMAAAVGMTAEEYAALSNRERKELMVRQGDFGAMMEAAQQQASQLQQQGTAARPGTGQGGARTQYAVPALTPEQQAQIMAIPGMTPEQRAQLQAVMSQMQGGGPGGMPGVSAPGASSAATTASASAPANAQVLKLDAQGRGFIEYANPAGAACVLRIVDQRSGAQLLEKKYRDSRVYEYLDFTRFGVPLEQISIRISDSDGQLLEQMSLLKK